MSKKKVGIIAAIAAGVLLLGGAGVAIPLIIKNSGAKDPSTEEPVESSQDIAESETETTEKVTYPEGITWYDVNDEVMLLLFGDYLGIPNPLSYYMIELLPYVAKDIPGWERRMMNREMIMAEKAGQYGFDG